MGGDGGGTSTGGAAVVGGAVGAAAVAVRDAVAVTFADREASCVAVSGDCKTDTDDVPKDD